MKSSSSLLRLVVVASLWIYFFCAGTFAAASAAPSPQEEAAPATEEVSLYIPGPLRSFMRMAGISQKISPDEVVPLLSHSVYSQGYEGSETKGRATEFLILLSRYVHQARELSGLAGRDGVIHVSGCDDAPPLLRVLGYRLRQDCGQSNTSLITADAERAFITTDSGFPLPQLEETLQGGKPFAYSYSSSRVPLLFREYDWTAASRENRNGGNDFLDTLLHDPALARLYWALSRMDPETRAALQKSAGLRKLLPFAGVLDFYGSYISIRSGRILVPGASDAESAWKELVGVSPESPVEFVLRLLAKDKGWMAAYFDALSRINQSQLAHFTAERLLRCYDALRGGDLSADASRPAFRPAPGLLLLVNRLQWDRNGEPHVPGNLDLWKQIFRQKSDSKLVRVWGKRSLHWNSPWQLVEAMFALSRVETDTGPLQMYLTLSELDSRRSPEQPLSPETARLLAARYARFNAQYLIFSEFPDLNDVSITRFVITADAVDKIPNHTLRGNTMGTFQAMVGLWQIMARQGQIPGNELNDSWQKTIKPFARIASSAQLFDAGRNSLSEFFRTATGKANRTQDEFVDFLAGPHQAAPEGRRMHQEMAARIRSVMEAQRLVSLDTLLALGQGLNQVAQGTASSDSLVALAGELREFQMPRPIFTANERTEWAAGIYNNRHTEMQMRTDLMKAIKSPDSRAHLEEARGELAPFLRDTLVGLNYAYYEPPGAQVLHHNPLFVRSHDFAGETVTGVEAVVWQSAQLFGEGSPAGGGAHLVGSLADLPYVLAEVEQDFIAPENVQALIWRELVPGLVISATLPRWWAVSPVELHAVTLYQRAGEELLAAAVGNEELRTKVLGILGDRMAPRSLERLNHALGQGKLEEILPQIMPADTFYLTAEFGRRFPQENGSWGGAGRELDSLARRNPAELSWERLSRDFGVPHPTLAQNYARELLNLRPFPALSGYSSRLLSESWDSSNLYWARLADEMGYSPALLNRLVPELTRRMIEKIFATEFEDWPAILRAMRETGQEFRQGKLALRFEAAPLPQPSPGRQRAETDHGGAK
jgi:hypothetical protein